MASILRQSGKGVNFVAASGPGCSPAWTDLRLTTAAGTLLLVLLGSAVFYLGGPQFPSGNNIFHVPLVLDYFGSDEGPHDRFHQSLGGFVSWFWAGLRLLATEENLQLLFLLVNLGGFVVTMVGLLLLVRVAAGKLELVALLGVVLIGCMPSLNGASALGGGELLFRVASHSQWATGLCLIALAAAVGRRCVIAAVLIGAAANINLFLAVWTAAIIYVARIFLFDGSEGAAKKAFLAWFPAVILLLAAPTLIWILWSSAPAHLPFSYRAFLYEYYPGHFFIHVSPQAAIDFTLLASATLLVAFRLAAGGPVRRLAMLLVSALAVLGAASVLMYLTDNSLILNLHPLRMAGLVTLALCALLLLLWLEQRREPSHRPHLLLLAFLGMGMAGPQTSLLALALLVHKFEPRWRLLSWLAVAAAVVSGIVVPRPEMTAGLVLPVFTLMLWPVIALGWAKEKLSLRLALGSAFWLVAALPAIASEGAFGGKTLVIALAHWMVMAAAAALSPRVARRRIFTPAAVVGAAALAGVAGGTALAARSDFAFDEPPVLQDFLNAQRWARQNTPAGSLFMEHRTGLTSSFSTMSRRPVWWSWKFGAATMWDPSYYAEWNERRLRVEAAGDQIAGQLELARAEGIPYLVSSRAHAKDIGAADIAFANRSFVIVRAARADRVTAGLP